MTGRRGQCPDCETHDTDRVYTEWSTDTVEETRVCNSCQTQYTNQLSLFAQDIEEPLGGASV